jgi:hypothetical protein
VHHDETRDDEEEVHSGIAVGDQPVEQRQFGQAVIGDRQGFHGPDVVDHHEQGRETAKDLDGL